MHWKLRRSILAEAILNSPAVSKGRFKAYSAGSHPKDEVNPLALEILRLNHLPIDGFRSKSWADFAGPAAPPLHFVFTVCDQAGAEVCPICPGQPMTAHWGIPDPAAVQGSFEERLRAFRNAFIYLRRRIELFTSLALETIGRLALQERLNEIGRS